MKTIKYLADAVIKTTAVMLMVSMAGIFAWFLWSQFGPDAVVIAIG
jgi:TRAP-type C4-dicarboxylate transport system permease large subunit